MTSNRYLWWALSLRLTLCFQLKSKHCRYNCFMMTLRSQTLSVLNKVFINWLQHILPWETSLQNGIHFWPTYTCVPFFHAQDLKRYGFSEILAPVVRDIIVLEREGIEIPLQCSCLWQCGTSYWWQFRPPWYVRSSGVFQCKVLLQILFSLKRWFSNRIFRGVLPK